MNRHEQLFLHREFCASYICQLFNTRISAIAARSCLHLFSVLLVSAANVKVSAQGTETKNNDKEWEYYLFDARVFLFSLIVLFALSPRFASRMWRGLTAYAVLKWEKRVHLLDVFLDRVGGKRKGDAKGTAEKPAKLPKVKAKKPSKKAAKDPNVPKRPASGFFIFMWVPPVHQQYSPCVLDRQQI